MSKPKSKDEKEEKPWKKNSTLKIILASFAFLMAMPAITFAQGAFAEDPLLELQMPGRVEGTDSYFEIIDSEYLNITLESTEEIKVVLESIPKMISLDINFSTDFTSTNLTVSGLEPNTTFYKFQDSYKNKAVFVSDKKGDYTWTQDLTQSHYIWIQPQKDARIQSKGIQTQSGSDGIIFLPEECSFYGIWNEGASTCTLNQDLTESVEITENNITLDCDDHSIIGIGTGHGIYSKNSSVRLKNCIVDNFTYGIRLGFYPFSYNNVVENNEIRNNYIGICFCRLSNSRVENNILLNNRNGIDLINMESSSIIGNRVSGGHYGIIARNVNNNIFDNNILELNWYGISFVQSSNNTITYNIASKNKTGIINVGFADIDSSNNIFSHNICTFNEYEGFSIQGSNNTLTNNTANYNNQGGIRIHYWSKNTLSDNSTSNNYYGISIYCSSENILTNNIALNNQVGISLGYASKINLITNNNIFGNDAGLSFDRFSENNKIYHNNFINNGFPSIYTHWGGGWGIFSNFFDDGYPSGGNYWSDYSGVDLFSGSIQDQSGSDGIGDTPYQLGWYQLDRYPFMEESGWETPQASTYKVAVILAESSNVPHKASSTTPEQPCKLIPEKTYLKGHNEEYYQDLAYCVTDYHKENSFGTVNLDFEIFDNDGEWFELTKNEQNYLGKEREFVIEAINLAESSGIDLSDKDMVIVLHSGTSYQKARDKTKLHTRTWVPNEQPFGYPPHKIIVAEDDMVGGWAHEIGHILGVLVIPLPDNTITPDLAPMGFSSVFTFQEENYDILHHGDWDIMAEGSWNEDANNPSYMSSYTKEFLQWLNYDIHPKSAYGEYWINSLETSNLGDNIFRYNLSNDTNDESEKYYILEARNRDLKTWDSSLPGLTSKHLILYKVDTKGLPEYGYVPEGITDYEKGMMWNQYRKITIPKSGFLGTNDGILNPLINETYKDLDNLVEFTAITDRVIDDKYEIQAKIEEITNNSFIDEFLGVILKPKDFFRNNIKHLLILNPSKSYAPKQDFTDTNKPDEDQKEAERDILSSAEFYTPEFGEFEWTDCSSSSIFAVGTIEAIKPLRKEASDEMVRRLLWSKKSEAPCSFAMQVRISSDIPSHSFLKKGYTQIAYIKESVFNKKSLKVGDEIGGFYYRYGSCDILLEHLETTELDGDQEERGAEWDILSSAEFYNPYTEGPPMLAGCFRSTVFTIGTIEAIKPLRKGDSHSIARGLLWPGEFNTPNLLALQIKVSDYLDFSPSFTKKHTQIVYIEKSLLNKKFLEIGDKIGGFYYLGFGCDTLISSVYKIKTLKFFLFLLLLFIISLIWLIRRILFNWKAKKIKKILTIGALVILTVFLIYVFSILFYAVFITPYLEKGEIASSKASIVKSVNAQHSLSFATPPQTPTTLPDLDLHLYCDDGRHIGMNYKTGEYEIGISEAIVSGDNQDAPEWILIPPEIESCHFIVSSYDNQKFLEENPEIAQEMEDTTDSYEIYARYIDPETAIYTSDVISEEQIEPGQELEQPITGTTDIAVLPAIPWQTPKLLKEQSITLLEGSKTDNKAIDREIDLIIQHISKSLNESLWIDDFRLDSNQGRRVLSEQSFAVSRLYHKARIFNTKISILERIIEIKQKFGLDTTKEEAEIEAINIVLPVFNQVVDNLIKADKLIAEIAINDAKNAPVENPRFQDTVNRFIEKAERELLRADKEISKARPDKAIMRLSQSWSYAQLAVKFAVPPFFEFHTIGLHTRFLGALNSFFHLSW